MIYGPVPLHLLRCSLATVFTDASGVDTVMEYGCGNGQLLAHLGKVEGLGLIVGAEV